MKHYYHDDKKEKFMSHEVHVVGEDLDDNLMNNIALHITSYGGNKSESVENMLSYIDTVIGKLTNAKYSIASEMFDDVNDFNNWMQNSHLKSSEIQTEQLKLNDILGKFFPKVHT